VKIAFIIKAVQDIRSMLVLLYEKKRTICYKGKDRPDFTRKNKVLFYFCKEERCT